MADHPKPIQTWVATAYLDAPPQGQNHPVFFECQHTKSGERRPFLVKSMAALEPMAKELMGNLLAQIAGLRTPEPALVFIDDGLAHSVNQAIRATGRYMNILGGYAPGAAQFVSTRAVSVMRTPDLDPESAMRLFVFDMLAFNADRKEVNPNCAMTADGLIVFDFEQCFDAEPRFVEDDVPLFAVASRGLGNQHMFYTSLKGQAFVRETVHSVVSSMTDRRLEDCVEELPTGWLNEGARIADHIKFVRSHVDEFVEDIVRTLSK